MNIWILYYSSLFLHILILYNFIFLIILFSYSKDFNFFLLLQTDISTDTICRYIPKARGTIYFIYHHNTITSMTKLFPSVF